MKNWGLAVRRLDADSIGKGHEGNDFVRRTRKVSGAGKVDVFVGYGHDASSHGLARRFYRAALKLPVRKYTLWLPGC